MKDFAYPNFKTEFGHMTERTQSSYITQAIADGLLPDQAHRMAEIVSLDASNDPSKPIQFWQLFSVLGPQPIIEITKNFYERVFWDEEWFREVFSRVGPLEHHVNTQASMWADVMGGGPYYHGGEFRLNFHHHHNAMALMTNEGARRWAALMRVTLDEVVDGLTTDPRVRPSINTFLTYFFGKYADDFKFDEPCDFGTLNPPVVAEINFRNMTDKQIAALSEAQLRSVLASRGVDISDLVNKNDLVSKATSL